MPRKSFLSHPEFDNASDIADKAIRAAFAEMGVSFNGIPELRLDRLADDLTRVLLAGHDWGELLKASMR